MTSNQLAYSQNLENSRHNQAYEAEINRHNVETEDIEKRRNEITDWFNRENVRLGDQRLSLEETNLLLRAAESWSQVSGTIPTEIYDNILSSYKANRIFGLGVPTLDYAKKWVSDQLQEVARLDKANESWYNDKIQELARDSSRLSMSYAETYVKYLQGAEELRLKHEEQNKRFEVWDSEVLRNTEQKHLLSAQAEEVWANVYNKQYYNQLLPVTYWTQYGEDMFRNITGGFKDVAKGVGYILPWSRNKTQNTYNYGNPYPKGSSEGEVWKWLHFNN